MKDAKENLMSSGQERLTVAERAEEEKRKEHQGTEGDVMCEEENIRPKSQKGCLCPCV